MAYTATLGDRVYPRLFPEGLANRVLEGKLTVLHRTHTVFGDRVLQTIDAACETDHPTFLAAETFGGLHLFPKESSTCWHCQRKRRCGHFAVYFSSRCRHLGFEISGTVLWCRTVYIKEHTVDNPVQQ